MPVVEWSCSTSFLFRLQHPFPGVFFTEEWCGEYVVSGRKDMPTTTSPKQQLDTPSQVRRVRGQPGDLYDLIFLDQQDRIIVPLTEWYRLRKDQGPMSTRKTHLACLQSYFAVLAASGCAWNAPPERLRQTLIAFHRDRLKCQIRPQRDSDTVEITLTRETPLRESTLKVMRAALRDFYLVMKEAGLYAFANPLSSDMLLALKREQERALANKGAPDQAGIREETHEQSRRRPTAFLRQHRPQEWKPEARNGYLEQMRPLHDPEGRRRLIDVEPSSPLFLTERGTPYSPKAFYWHWYRHYTPLRALCPVRFAPHDLRHLFVTEYLIKLKL